MGRLNEDGAEAVATPQLASSSELFQLRVLAQDRIVNEMIAEVLKNCTLSPDYVILVLDDYTVHLFSQLRINFYDLYRHKVYQVEDLNKQRKRYPMTDAIYFIEPSLESVRRILDDFPAKDPIDYDQYGQTHLVFTSSCPESLLEDIAQNPKLTAKTMTFLEANVDFQIFTDNIFLVSAKVDQQPNEPLVSIKSSTSLTPRSQLSERDFGNSITFKPALTRQVYQKVVK